MGLRQGLQSARCRKLGVPCSEAPDGGIQISAAGTEEPGPWQHELVQVLVKASDRQITVRDVRRQNLILFWVDRRQFDATWARRCFTRSAPSPCEAIESLRCSQVLPMLCISIMGQQLRISFRPCKFGS